MVTSTMRSIGAPRLILLALVALVCLPRFGDAQQPHRKANSIIHKIDSPQERLEMIVNSSRILSLGTKIPRAQVNNQEVVEVTALSPNQIQIFAKKPGVTQVNLWNEAGEISTVDIVVYGDVRQLSLLLKQQFPKASLRLVPAGNSIVLSGFVPESDQVSRIVRMSEQYYSNVINNMEVGGVQQVMLHVKVMEVSRTKLRRLGVDFAALSSSGFLTSSISGMITSTTGATVAASGDTLRFGIVENSSFFGFLEALRQNDLLKILAEPTLVAVSGRPASFLVGGEFPILVPQGLGAVSIEFRKFGTEIDFVPLVLGNGNIRLEVRPRVSEIDNTRGITLNGVTVPSLLVREVNTGVEMKAGQTLALAGLVQTRTESQNIGIPWVSDLPFFGTFFRKVQETRNEIELLILVRPELVDALDPHEVPPGGPGTNSCSPDDIDLFMRGHLEVPCCYGNGACGPNCNHGARQGFPIEILPSSQPALPAQAPAIQTPPTRPLPSQPNVSPQARAPQANKPVASARSPSSPYATSSGPPPRWSTLRQPSTAYPSAPSPSLAPARPDSSAALLRQPVMPAVPRINPPIRSNPPLPQLRAPRVDRGNPPGLIGPIGYNELN
jgi:pilus assembly protein CpaC